MTHRPAQMPASEIYQLKITLKDIRPPIWRRIQVSGDVKLSKLHQILQVVMGWTDSHLHQFVIRGKYFCEPNPEADFGLEKEIDEKTVRLSQVVPCASRRFSYKYDFGDGWRHEILVEKILPGERGTRYPVCLAGKRNCPPEDCGGPWGYAELLEALADESHPEHANLLDWVGGSFDPEEFDLDEINVCLRDLRRAG